MKRKTYMLVDNKLNLPPELMSNLKAQELAHIIQKDIEYLNRRWDVRILLKDGRPAVIASKENNQRIMVTYLNVTTFVETWEGLDLTSGELDDLSFLLEWMQANIL